MDEDRDCIGGISEVDAKSERQQPLFTPKE